VHLRNGNVEKAIITLERGLRLCQIWNIRRWLPRTASALGYAYALSGQITEALPLLEQAVELREVGIISYLVGQLGKGYLLAGRIEDAIVQAGGALDLARQYKQRGDEAYALRLLSEIAAHKDPPDVEAAEGHYRQALALAEELGMRPLVAHCHVGLGKLYRRIGSRQQAEEHLTTAIAMMREVKMGLWLKQAEAELKELG
jgi:tetratricopeptide (TPR) repeat protein